MIDIEGTEALLDAGYELDLHQLMKQVIMDFVNKLGREAFMECLTESFTEMAKTNTSEAWQDNNGNLYTPAPPRRERRAINRRVRNGKRRMSPGYGEAYTGGQAENPELLADG